MLRAALGAQQLSSLQSKDDVSFSLHFFSVEDRALSTFVTLMILLLLLLLLLVEFGFEADFFLLLN